jgi:hypothetical protein
MITRVVPYVWDAKIDDYREIPLDDASPWIIEVARLLIGSNASHSQIRRALAREGPHPIRPRRHEGGEF